MMTWIFPTSPHFRRSLASPRNNSAFYQALPDIAVLRQVIDDVSDRVTGRFDPPSDPPPPPKDGERKESPFKDFSTRGDVIVTDDDGEIG